MAGYDQYLDHLMVQCRQSMTFPYQGPSHQSINSHAQAPWRCAPLGQYNRQQNHLPGRSTTMQVTAQQANPSQGFAIVPPFSQHAVGPNPSASQNSPATRIAHPTATNNESMQSAPASTETAQTSLSSTARGEEISSEAATVEAGVQPGDGDNGIPEAHAIPRKRRGKNLGPSEHETLLRCCLEYKRWCKSRLYTRYWKIVSLRFKKETLISHTCARQTIMRLLEKRQLELAEENRIGRIQIPRVASNIRPLLDEFGRVLNGDDASSIAGPHVATDLSTQNCAERAVHHDEAIDKVDRIRLNNTQASRKRKVEDWIRDIATANDNAGPPLERRTKQASSAHDEANAQSSSQDSRPKDDTASDSSPSYSTSGTSLETDSLSSASDEDDLASDDESEDSDDNSSVSQELPRSPRTRMRQRRQFNAKVSSLRRAVTESAWSTEELLSNIKWDKIRRVQRMRRIVTTVHNNLATYLGLGYLEKRLRHNGNPERQRTQGMVQSLEGLIAADNEMLRSLKVDLRASNLLRDSNPDYKI